MPLINVMRHMARDAGWSDRDFDVALSVYVDTGTMTDAERASLLTMAPDERRTWAVGRVPVDALPMIRLDFDAHGFFSPGLPMAKFDGPPWPKSGDES